MRFFGHPVTKMLQYARSKAVELDDLEVVADPTTLRRLGAFFQDVATDMEAKGARFEHVHLLDAWDAHGTKLPDLVVSRDENAA